MVLLHGITDSRRSFDLVLPHLPSSVRAIAVSQRGHGDSERPPAGYSMAELAEDVDALLDTLEVPSAVVVGHSMGSIVARRFAMDHPARCTGMVLVGAFGSLTDRSDLQAYASYIASLQGPLDRAFAERSQREAVQGGAPVPQSFIDSMVSDTMKVPVTAVQAAFTGMFADDAMADLDWVKAPTLLVRGELDTVSTVTDQEQLLSALPQARSITYQNAGHKPHWHYPERFARNLSHLVGDLS